MRLNGFVRAGVAALAAFGIASVAPASAADGYNGGGSLKDQPLYIPPTWTGFYLGGHVGGAWSANNDNNDRPEFFTFPAFAGRPETQVLLSGNRNNNNDVSAVFGGLQFGYNLPNLGWFSPNWLFGVEVDLGGFGADDNNRTFFATDRFGDSAFIRARNGASGFYGDLTNRIGYTWGNVLIYGKGGYAFLNTDNNDNTESIVFSDGTVQSFRDGGGSRTLRGWTIGGGIEYMLSPNWTLKVEYLYFDFTQNRHCCFDGVFDPVSGAPLNNFRFENDLTLNTVKVGFNYLLHPPTPALPMK
jgi:outer membrane immunogenic protein